MVFIGHLVNLWTLFFAFINRFSFDIMSKISLNELNNYYEDEGSQPSGSSTNKKRKMVKGNIKIEKKNKPRSE